MLKYNLIINLFVIVGSHVRIGVCRARGDCSALDRKRNVEMPPKKKGDAPNKKTVEKKKEKVIEVRNSLCVSIFNISYSWQCGGSCHPLCSNAWAGVTVNPLVDTSVLL